MRSHRLTEWTSDTETGDRDDLAPGVTDRAWRQVSVTARECLGKSRCPVGEDCFAERARAKAAQADVVVTNHALLAIDAITGIAILPEHDVVVVDEAHELVDRVTSVATAEMAGDDQCRARRCAKLVEEQDVDRLEAAARDRGPARGTAAGRWDGAAHGAATGARRCATGVERAHRHRPGPPGMAVSRSRGRRRRTPHCARSRKSTTAPSASSAPSTSRIRPGGPTWCGWPPRKSRCDRRVLRVAPLSVGGLLRAWLFANATVVLTSATLTVGGSFDGLAAQLGTARRTGRRSDTRRWRPAPKRRRDSRPRSNGTPSTSGSPFDHARAGILYVAKHLRRRAATACRPPISTRSSELVAAAGGRTLGLFSSMRAAKAAAEALRDRLDTPILCQGDDSTGRWSSKFAERRADLPVRHAVAVAGRRRARARRCSW